MYTGDNCHRPCSTEAITHRGDDLNRPFPIPTRKTLNFRNWRKHTSLPQRVRLYERDSDVQWPHAITRPCCLRPTLDSFAPRRMKREVQFHWGTPTLHTSHWQVRRGVGRSMLLLPFQSFPLTYYGRVTHMVCTRHEVNFGW